MSTYKLELVVNLRQLRGKTITFYGEAEDPRLAKEMCQLLKRIARRRFDIYSPGINVVILYRNGVTMDTHGLDADINRLELSLE